VRKTGGAAIPSRCSQRGGLAARGARAQRPAISCDGIPKPAFGLGRLALPMHSEGLAEPATLKRERDDRIKPLGEGQTIDWRRWWPELVSPPVSVIARIRVAIAVRFATKALRPRRSPLSSRAPETR